MAIRILLPQKIFLRARDRARDLRIFRREKRLSRIRERAR